MAKGSPTVFAMAVFTWSSPTATMEDVRNVGSFFPDSW
ncbi:MAG: hypothetical protein H6Q21_1953 [Bacteroidetes bacterium]|nr:hypothetical protein [Bacteroidota bacterium]